MNLDQFLLALTVWREARGESFEGQRAVMHVILNRAMAQFRGRDVAGVCTWPMQFSSMTTKGDSQTVVWPAASDEAWKRICSLVMNDPGVDPTNGAFFYYATNIPPPSWADISKFTVQIGAHRFYKQ